jgi:hypothetical protein
MRRDDRAAPNAADVSPAVHAGVAIVHLKWNDVVGVGPSPVRAERQLRDESGPGAADDTRDGSFLTPSLVALLPQDAPPLGERDKARTLPPVLAWPVLWRRSAVLIESDGRRLPIPAFGIIEPSGIDPAEPKFSGRLTAPCLFKVVRRGIDGVNIRTDFVDLRAEGAFSIGALAVNGGPETVAADLSSNAASCALSAVTVLD